MILSITREHVYGAGIEPGRSEWPSARHACYGLREFVGDALSMYLWRFTQMVKICKYLVSQLEFYSKVDMLGICRSVRLYSIVT